MEYINKIELVGIVGSVQLTRVADKDMTIITLMTQETLNDLDALVIECCWTKVVFFNKVELKKGDSARVIGRLKQRNMTDSNGNQYVTYDIVATTLEKVD